MATDILTDVEALINNNWIPGNTGTRTPLVDKLYDVKRIDLRSQDIILLKEVLARPQDNSHGAASKERSTLIVVDFRTTFSRDQVQLMMTELERIFNNAQVDPFGDQVYEISDIEDIRDLSENSVKLFRKQMDVRFQQFNLTI